MKRKSIFLFFLIVFLNTAFAQFDDILKKIPGVGNLFEEAVTTSIKDAYPTAYWLSGLDTKLTIDNTQQFSENLSSGFYKFRFNTFCLHAGKYAPTDGAGYLVAPLKGAKANLIRDILSRYTSHPEVEQKDLQILLWGIEANQKFSNYPADFQLRVQPLLKPEEIAMMEVDVKKIGYDLLPQDVQEILGVYDNLRDKMSSATSTYEDIEQVAVKTGIAPIGKGSKNIDAGTWTSIGDGVYMRCFPEGYKKSNVDIYIPADVKIEKDKNGNIVSLDDGSSRLELNYASGSAKFNTALVKNLATGEESTIQNTLTDDATLKKESDDFLSLVKKSFGKKRKKLLTDQSLKTVQQLKYIEQTMNSLADKSGGAYQLSVNSVNKFIGDIETGLKGGSENHKTGLGNVNGFVFAPANTSEQRLGNGGPEGGNPPPINPPDPKKPPKDKDCKVNVSMSQINETEWPEPDHVFSITVNIDIQGTDEKCQAEKIDFELFDVSKEKGRCLNDLEQMDDVDEDLQMSDLNTEYSITKLTASKSLTGTSQTQTIYIVCRDWGAFGKLKATVTVGGQTYEGEGDGTPDKFVTIPLDLNDNKIADGWEKKNGVYGKPGDWDEDPNPKGQERNGDGITNYEEYRGFYVSDGSAGKEHVRTDPNKKEIFVIDEDNLFDRSSWKAATGIDAYWLTSGMYYGAKGGGIKDQDYRWVDFCRGNAPGVKYAVHLVKQNGMTDTYGDEQSPYTFGYNVGDGTPKTAQIDVMFPDRIRNWLLQSADSLKAVLKKFPKGFQIDGIVYSKKEVQNVVDQINNPAKLDVLVDFWLNLCTLHEVGHACSVDHHGKGNPNKTSTGSPLCPMLYRSEYNLVKMDLKMIGPIMKIIDKEGITPIVSYIGWRFCKSKDNCWKQLNVNDR